MVKKWSGKKLKVKYHLRNQNHIIKNTITRIEKDNRVEKEDKEREDIIKIDKTTKNLLKKTTQIKSNKIKSKTKQRLEID